MNILILSALLLIPIVSLIFFGLHRQSQHIRESSYAAVLRLVFWCTFTAFVFFIFLTIYLGTPRETTAPESGGFQGAGVLITTPITLALGLCVGGINLLMRKTLKIDYHAEKWIGRIGFWITVIIITLIFYLWIKGRYWH